MAKAYIGTGRKHNESAVDRRLSNGELNFNTREIRIP